MNLLVAVESWVPGPVAEPLRALAVALLLYGIVVLLFRLGKRRTVAELAPFDLAAVIAVGAITGRTATGGNSLLVGIGAVLGLMLGHWVVSRLRRRSWFERLVDHPTSLLIVNGRFVDDELRRTGLTQADAQAALRSHGIRSMQEVTLAVFETRSGVSVLTGSEDAPLWQRVVIERR